MAAVCQHFVQNAWKKELCSNCFKSKEEHGGAVPNVSSMWCATAIIPQGILRDALHPSRRPKGTAVRFPAEESHVIGFGGEECFSSDDGDDSCDLEEDSPPGSEDEEDKALQRLTRSNTDFNTSARPFSSLLLGQPRRETLLVTVKPFGDNIVNPKDKPSVIFSDKENNPPPVEVIKQTETIPLEKKVVEDVHSNCTLEINKHVSLADIVKPAEEVKPIHEDKIISRIPVIKSRTDKPKTVIRASAFNGRSDLLDNKLTIKKVENNQQETVKPSEEVKVKKDEEGKPKQIMKIIQPKEDVVALNLESSIITHKFIKTEDKAHEKSTEVETLSVVETHNLDVKREIITKPTKEVEKRLFKLDEVSSKLKFNGIYKKLEEKDICTLSVRNIDTEHFVQTKIKDSEARKIASDQFEQTKIKDIETRKIDSEHFVQTKIKDSEARKIDDHFVQTKIKDSEARKIVSDRFEQTKIKDIEAKEIDDHFVQSKIKDSEARKLDGDYFVQIKNKDSETRKIDSEPFVQTKIKDGEYKASKVMVEPEEVKKLEIEEIVFPVEESRELAGEPDGRADSDEPPELPRSPPPTIDPRPSFLHGMVQRKTFPLADKPKIPVKPNKVLQASSTPRKCQPVVTLPAQNETTTEVPGVECSRTPKRQAPKPPPTPQPEETSALPLFTRNPSAGHKSNSPVTREKEKRERASSCSPKIRDTVSESPAPEPAPRRSLSLSVESLTNVPAPVVEQEKKKVHGRGRFSLRKFLRFGHHKDDEKHGASPVPPRVENIPVIAPLPRPRLEIIHPSDLNGAAVEVVTATKHNPEDTASTSSGSSDSKETEVMSCDSSNSQSSCSSPTHSTTARPNKPPPPPRNQSLDAWGKTLEGLNKPARPPPPKSAELLRQQKQAAVPSPTPAVTDNLYANLGEVRSALAPNKPQRTASIRDTNTEGPKRKAQGEDSGYESVELIGGKPTTASANMQTGGENVYESVGGRSSSPECDVGVAKISSGRYVSQHRRSEGTIDTSPEFLKFRGSFVRSTSLPYCGSETESDIYSPYSFYSSEEGCEEDTDWSTTPGHPLKMSRLKLRKGRSIVHKSLEDNYGAVIVANHEALSQVLEQVNLGSTLPLALRGLKTAANLRWSDFTVPDESRAVAVGRRMFHPAQWASHPITLCLTVDQGLQSGLPARGGTSTLTPITEFCDLVPARYLPPTSKTVQDMVQASVAVLNKLHVDTIKSYGCSLRDINGDDHWKDGSFILLQLVNGLKLLQAQGIEEAPLSLSSFVLCREDRDPQPRLCVLHELNTAVPRAESNGSLCQCALAALVELLPGSQPLARLVGDLLTQERASSLSQVKSVLEFSLWGPADVALGAPLPDRELALQRWLDLERATVLHGLVRTRIDLTPFEECHLLFLVRTNAKMMSEASLLLDSCKTQQ